MEELKDKEAIEEFVLSAKKAGMPQDQLEGFIGRKYIPLQWQLNFHARARECDKEDGPVEVVGGGARGPGKSHCVFAQIGLDDCQRFKNLKGLFLRKTGKAAKESFEDLVFKVLSGKIQYEYTTNVLKFNNGSKVVMGGFETENDVDKYIGIEYDFIAIEEMNQLSKEKVQKLKGSLRTSRKDWRPRLYGSFNPGGIGHGFVKETYVIPYREGKESKTRFIPSTYLDNPYLNKEYIEYLEDLEGSLGRAWREGDFDLFEGQFFNEWRHDKHVVMPFKIPENWIRLRSIDPSGRAGFTSCHWYAIDNDGTCWVYREYYATGKDASEHADKIASLSEGEEYKYTAIDGAAFSKLGLPETTAEVYIRHGVNGLVPASKSRVMGWNSVHEYLRWDEFNEPRLKVFSTCPNMIRTFPEVIHDEKHPEDIDTSFRKYKLNGVEGNEHWDAIDECRYLLQTLREQKNIKPLNIVERRIEQILLNKKSDEFKFDYKK